MRFWMLAVALLAASPFDAAAQDARARAALRPSALRVLDAAADTPVATVRRGGQRLDARTGAVRAAFRLDEPTAGGDAGGRARAYLAQHARTLGLDGVALRLARAATGRYDAHVSFEQTVGDLPLEGARVHVALSPAGRVQQVAQTAHADAARWGRTHALAPATLAGADAEAAVRREAVATAATVAAERVVALWRPEAHDVRPAWRVAVQPHGVAAAWTVWVDASTGALLRVAEAAGHAAKTAASEAPAPPDGPAGRSAPALAAFAATAADVRRGAGPRAAAPGTAGSGLVFSPDPLTTARVPYGASGYVDGNDTATPQLSAERRVGALPDLASAGGRFVLHGPYVEITGDASVGGTAFTPPSESDPTAFRYERSDARFEAVMAYHHLDALQRYVQSLQLGRPVLQRPVRVNPHGLGTQDNSVFYPSTFALAFGDGGIDDAEDADVLRHEYTHALLHDQAPDLFATLEGRALHEGYADYLAASFSRAAGDPAWRRVYTWDGNAGCWQGRTLDHAGRYSSTDRSGMAYPAAPGCPAFAQLYQWGLLWATTLADLSEDVGTAAMDRLVLGSMAYVTAASAGVPPFEAAAEALLAADRALFAGAHRSALESRLVARGMLPARRAPALSHTPVSEPGATRLLLRVDVRDGSSPVASVVVRPLAVRLADTLALAPVTLQRDGTGTTFSAEVAVPAGAVALRYAFVATDADGRTATAGPFEAYVRLVARTDAAATAHPGALWERFGTAWAAAPRSLTGAPAPERDVSSLSLTPLDLPQNAEALRLVLRHRVLVQDGVGARAMLSADDGRSWLPLVPLGGYPATFRAPGHPMDGAAVFARDDTTTATFDLTPWRGTQVRVRFDLGAARPLEGGEAWTVRSATLLALTPDAAFAVPRTAALSQPFPNPFADRTRLSVTVPEATTVSVEVVDVLGRRVAVLMERQMADAGTYPLAFEGVAAGVYVVRATVGGRTFTRTVVAR